MKRCWTWLCLTLLVFPLAACMSKEKTTRNHVIIWQNHDGKVLAIDRDLKDGTMPTYAHETPTRPEDERHAYEFAGWWPEPEPITRNMTYTARYTALKKKDPVTDRPEQRPVRCEDGTITYGFYPRTHVSDETTISRLDALTTATDLGWYQLDDAYYVKEEAHVFSDENYSFSDGTRITTGDRHWFRCDPIRWEILKEEDEALLLLSKELLDAHVYHSTYDSEGENAYPASDIRTWLNETFCSTAFSLGSSDLLLTDVDNSASTTDAMDNTHAGKNTKDRVFLLSYQDCLNTTYGFKDDPAQKDEALIALTTDYARAHGAYADKSTCAGSYWTRSPTSTFSYCAWNVDSGGFLSQYAIDGTAHAVRPLIRIKRPAA